MANKDFYKASDVPQFQQDVCLKTCVCKGKCISDGRDKHWFLMCPHYHSWKLGYSSFIWDHLEWEHEHPEEAKKKYEEKVERAKAWKAEQKAKAKAEKENKKKETKK